MTEFEQELVKKLIKHTNMEGVDLGEISANATLFGEGSAFELDSIDAIEIEVMIKEEFGIDIHPSERVEATFGSIGSLAAFIERNRNRDI
jgi:acyl carrier protein